MANSDDGEKNANFSQENSVTKSKMSGDLGWQSSHRKLPKPNFLDLKRVNHVDFLQTPDLAKATLTSPQIDSMAAQMPSTIPNLTPALEALPTMECVNSNHSNNTDSSDNNNISSIDYTINNNNNTSINFNNINNSNGTEEEKMKLERKRERNRQAAAKCRNKKIQKINELESKKAQLIKEKDALTENIKKHQDEIDTLQRLLVERIKNSGVIDLTY